MIDLCTVRNYNNAYTHTRYEEKQFIRYTIKEINSRNGKPYLLWQKVSRYATAGGTETTLKYECWCHDKEKT